MKIEKAGPTHSDPITLSLEPDEVDLVTDLLRRLGNGHVDADVFSPEDQVHAEQMADSLEACAWSITNQSR